MENRTYIKLNEVCTEYLNSRTLIQNAFTHSVTSPLVVDCDGVELISRAAAHELVTLLSSYEEKGIMVDLINMNLEVSSIVNIVKSSILTNKRNRSLLRKLTFSTSEELNDYILAI
jgi:anti-anti-sigma regulatory factor